MDNIYQSIYTPKSLLVWIIFLHFISDILTEHPNNSINLHSDIWELSRPKVTYLQFPFLNNYLEKYSVYKLVVTINTIFWCGDNISHYLLVDLFSTNSSR